MEGAEHGISEHEFRRMKEAMEDLKNSLLHCSKIELEVPHCSKQGSNNLLLESLE